MVYEGQAKDLKKKKSWVQKDVIALRRTPFTPPAPKGGAAPVLGRKFCIVCGRWRLLVDFDVHTRTANGAVLIWQSRCKTCTRLVKRMRYGHKPRPSKLTPEEAAVNRRKNYAKRMQDPERAAALREYQRIYKEALRREAGIPERPIGPRSTKAAPRGSDRELVPIAPLKEAAEGISSNEIARRIGWKKAGGKPDERRVSRTLGRAPDSDGHVREFVTVANAQLIAKAINILPAEVGV